MVKSLKAVLEIATEGAKKAAEEVGEVADALGKLVDAQKAYKSVAGAIGANIAAGPENLKTAKEDLAGLMEFAKGAGENFGDVILRLAELRIALGAIGVAGKGAVLFFTGVGKLASDAVLQISDAAAAMGVSVDQFQRMNFAAGQVGVAASDISASFSAISNAVRNATSDITQTEFAQIVGAGLVKPAAQMSVSFGAAGLEVQAFGKKVEGAQAIAGMLGVSFTDVMGTARATKDVWHDLVVALSGLPDGALKSKLALQLFGDSARKIAPYLSMGEEGLRRFDAEFNRLGLGMGTGMEEAAVKVEASFEAVWAKINAVKLQLGMIFAPFATTVADSFKEFLVAAQPSIDAFANYLTTTITPVINDIYALVQGRRGDVQIKWVGELADSVTLLTQIAEGGLTAVVIPAMKLAGEAAQFMADAFNSAFGTDFSAPFLAVAGAALYLSGAFSLIKSTVGLAVYSLVGVATAMKLVYDGGLLALPVIAKMVSAIRAFSLAGALASVFSGVGIWVAGLIAVGAALEGIYLYWDKIKLKVKEVTSFWTWALAKVTGSGNSDAAKKAFDDFKQAQAKLNADVNKGFTEDLKDRLKQQGTAIKDYMKDAMKVDTTAFNDLVNQFGRVKDAVGGVADETKRAGAEAKGAADSTGKALGTFGAGKVITDKDGKKTYQPGLKTIHPTETPEGVFKVIKGTQVSYEPKDRMPTVMRPSIPGGGGNDYTPLYKDSMPERKDGKIDTSGDIWSGARGRVDQNVIETVSSSAQKLKSSIDLLVLPFDLLSKSMGNLGPLSTALGTGQKTGASAPTVAEATPIAEEAQKAAKQVADALTPIPAAASPVPQAFRDLINAASGLGSAFAEAAAALRAQAANPGSSAPIGPGKATGGLITGPGTGTSDSVPIRASAGEYIVKASRVAELGLDFMHWVNGSMSMPSIFSRTGFADGGLVPAGAADAGGRSLTLVLDGRNYGGFSGSGSVVDELEKHASMRRMSSTTRRAPSRIS